MQLFALTSPCTERFPEPLEMHQFTLPQKPDGIPHVIIIRQPQDIVIGGACLLLCSHILSQVRNNISRRLEKACGKGLARGCNRVNACGMIDKIGVKTGTFDLLRRQIPGQLIHNRGDHLHVTEFLCTQVMYMKTSPRG